MSTTDDAPSAVADALLDELRTTFLFERLAEEQLRWIGEHGEVAVYPAGDTVYAEGEPATWFFVLLRGHIRLIRRVQSEDVIVTESDQRGVYGGAVRAYIDSGEKAAYANGMVAVEECRFFRLAAPDFFTFMHDFYPMAVHLLDGLYLGIRNAEATTGQREKLMALGALSAGLSHELNNPAAAAKRAVGALREKVAGMRGKLALLAEGHLDPELLPRLVLLQTEAVERASDPPELSAMAASDAEDELGDWLDEHDVRGGWDLAPALVAAGLGLDWADELLEAVGQDALEPAVRWLSYTVDTEALIQEIEEATSRISTLVGAVKQYSYMDQAPYQEVDLHAGLDSTLVMLTHKTGTGVRVERDFDRSLPRVPAYGGELNQVWTNLIDNAVDAMGGSGTLRLRTARDGDRVLVEIGDTGPGIPDDVRARLFEPFFTTKGIGKGSGLGLEISRRIIERRHLGEIRVESTAGDTRFQVLLPLTVPDAGAQPTEPDDAPEK